MKGLSVMWIITRNLTGTSVVAASSFCYTYWVGCVVCLGCYIATGHKEIGRHVIYKENFLEEIGREERKDLLEVLIGSYLVLMCSEAPP